MGRPSGTAAPGENMRIAICLLLLAATSRALTLKVTDSATGRPVTDGVQCGIVRGGEVHARFEGLSHAGAVAAGDRLYVYRRGYDLFATTLAAGAGAVDVALVPCRDACTVVVADPAVRLRVIVVRDIHGFPKPGPIRDTEEFTMHGERDVSMPRGLFTRVYSSSREALVWPRAASPRPGSTVRIRIDQPRVVAVRPPAGKIRVECLPDLTWQPDVDPFRIDAWRSFLHGPRWLTALDERRPELHVLPDVPFHVFARTGGHPLYRYVAPKQEKLDLSGPPDLRRLPRCPQVDGGDARAGSYVAPGRLDLFTVKTVWELRHRLRGCAVRIGETWTACDLPAADWLTVWHPEAGLAHLRWVGLDVPAGKTYPGRLRVKVPRGYEATGYVSAFPVWRGAGTIRAVPPEDFLRRRFDGDRPATWRGLLPGAYGLNVKVDLVRRRDGHRVSVKRMEELVVPAAGRTWTLPTR